MNSPNAKAVVRPTKTGDTSGVPIDEDPVDWIDRRLGKEDPQGFRYEGTKHSSATAWWTQSTPLEVARRMLRHHDTRSPERYGKLTDDGLAET